MWYINVLTLYLTLVWNITSIVTLPIAHTPWGSIQGTLTQDGDGNSLETYLGIPFALPPVGPRRFEKPVAHPGPHGTYNASSLSAPCIQVYPINESTQVVSGDEDCLYLNVYVPTSNTTRPRAVVVWIYGGAFYIGDTHLYNPSALATLGDVIAVTIQYRLGALGFLSTMDHASKGNYGLWDQLLALKWVKRNIGGFGGDPKQITIMGESAGSASVGFLTISPEAQGLFQRAILQSGSVTSSWAIRRNPQRTAEIVAKKCSCDHGNSQSVIACLRKVPASTLVRLSFPATDNMASLLLDVPYGPVVDGEFITDLPRNLFSKPETLMSSAFPTCDVMIGVNNNESGNLYGSAVETDTLYNTSFVKALGEMSFFKTQILPVYLNGYFGSSNYDMKEVATFEYLFPDPETLNMQSMLDFKADASFLIPAIEYARRHASMNGTARTYLYYFNHDPKIDVPMDGPNSRGMHHAYDLAYTFGFNKEIMSGLGVLANIPASELKLSMTFRKLLTDFVKFGDPASAVTSWPQFDVTTEKYLNLDDTPTVKSHLAERRASLWFDLLPRLLKTNTAE